MRQGYNPYIIPVLSGLPRGVNTDNLTSPIAEEQVIRARLERVPDWQAIAEQVRRIYGLQMVTEVSEQHRVSKLDSGPVASSRYRILTLDDKNRRWFLMEHPEAIEHFDRFAEGGRQAALARPSLFICLWREAEQDSQADSAELRSSSDESSLVILEQQLASIMENGQPSDWHIEAGNKIYTSRVRIEGRLITREKLPLGKGTWLIQSFLAAAGLKYQPERAQEGNLERVLPKGRISLRLSFIPTLHGPSLVVRFLYPGKASRFTLEKLVKDDDLRKEIQSAFAKRDGLWLTVGPTGSGKSTTLHALLRESVQANEKVLAVEDPVETTVEGVHHLNISSQSGLTYPLALRSFLRQSPDCVLVGEVRDPETAAIALQAARTGHRVLSTVHARDDDSLLRRFEDLGQSRDGLKSVITMVLHQRLVPVLCELCRKEEFIPASLREALNRSLRSFPPAFAREGGCSICGDGIKGRQAIFAKGGFPECTEPMNLLQPAWNLLLKKQITVKTLLPFLTPELRRHFQICQA